MVHYGQAERVRTQRSRVLAAAYAAHPERFVRQPPAPPALPPAVWINPPSPTAALPVVEVGAEAAASTKPPATSRKEDV